MSRYPHDDPRHELEEQDARAEDALARRDREDDHAPRTHSREDERLQREASQTRGLSHAEFEERVTQISAWLADAHAAINRAAELAAGLVEDR